MLRDLWQEVCSFDNLFKAYWKARKKKTTLWYVKEFEKNLNENLLLLRSDLLLHSYRPEPLVNFIVRDPKLRTISKSTFRDRVVHHAVCNIIEPIFDTGFIYDNWANRKGKGTLQAVLRFNHFKRKVSRNFTRTCYVLKADVKKYFENIDHTILLKIISRRISDPRVLWLIRTILANSVLGGGGARKRGMPLGNLTSQFFANVYLNELDQFVKHRLKAPHYLRYVDDFVILHHDKSILEAYKKEIDAFLRAQLHLELHPGKSKIISLHQGVTFLGFRIFSRHRLLKKSNLRHMKRKLLKLQEEFHAGKQSYDDLYDFLEGWLAYAKQGKTYGLRKTLARECSIRLQNEVSAKEFDRFARITKSIRKPVGETS
ncbi:MAG: reverse transcriptase domain-containing protein, partial [Nanoarchaeota archaeon]|nr:reverse transcriptase domain-containing protein [Nanoarchaeota archaeon]